MFDGMFDDKKFVIEYKDKSTDDLYSSIRSFDNKDTAIEFVKELRSNRNIFFIHLYHNNEEISINDECDINS